MGIDYDAWLQQPYQDECDQQEAYDRAEEKFRDSDSYWESYEEWLKTNIGKQEEWGETNAYMKSVESFQAMINEPQTEGDSR